MKKYGWSLISQTTLVVDELFDNIYESLSLLLSQQYYEL